MGRAGTRLVLTDSRCENPTDAGLTWNACRPAHFLVLRLFNALASVAALYVLQKYISTTVPNLFFALYVREARRLAMTRSAFGIQITPTQAGKRCVLCFYLSNLKSTERSRERLTQNGPTTSASPPSTAPPSTRNWRCRSYQYRHDDGRHKPRGRGCPTQGNLYLYRTLDCLCHGVESTVRYVSFNLFVL